jgi:hypothetical protein
VTGFGNPGVKLNKNILNTYNTVKALIIHTSDNPYSVIIHTFLNSPLWLAGKYPKIPYISDTP